MTRERAIDLLDNLVGMVEDSQKNDYDGALHMAIKALKQQSTCKTCINRTDCPWSNIDNGYCHKWSGE